MKDLASLFPILSEINHRAGEIARQYFGHQIEVIRKDDHSPVTRADREIELCIREMLEKNFPDHSIIGEEFGEIAKTSAYRWIIDPIDGTRSFLLNTPLFGTLIALERDGMPLLGSLYLPIQDQLMIGSRETGTFLNGKRCFVSKTANMKDATLIVTDPAQLTDFKLRPMLERLYRSVGQVRGFGDCYGYFLVASGAAEVMIDPYVKLHDIAPMLPIMQGAGGYFTSVEGRIGSSIDSGLATNRVLHQQVLSVIKGQAGSSFGH